MHPLFHCWQELIGNGTASQQGKNILRDYSGYNKRQVTTKEFSSSVLHKQT